MFRFASEIESARLLKGLDALSVLIAGSVSLAEEDAAEDDAADDRDRSS
jgi:hypothetical protein